MTPVAPLPPEDREVLRGREPDPALSSVAHDGRRERVFTPELDRRRQREDLRLGVPVHRDHRGHDRCAGGKRTGLVDGDGP